MTDRGWWMMVPALLALGACRGDRSGAERPDSTLTMRPPPPVELTLLAPDTLRWNQRDSVRIVLFNHTAAPLAGLRIALSISAPAAVDDSAADLEGGRSRIELSVPSVAAGTSVTVAGPIRMPPAPLAPDSAPRVYAVRVALATPALSREDTIHIRAGSERVSGGCGTASHAVAQRFGVGPVRVGISAAALRTACPEARDSSWEMEGTAETGLLVRPAGLPVLAVLVNDSVRQVVVSDSSLKTPSGTGVGTSLAALRARYGPPCMGRGEGTVAVWFQNAPGISFLLDSATTHEWFTARRPAGELPDSARVARYLIHGEDARCPAGGTNP
jgi:hypothetical protein